MHQQKAKFLVGWPTLLILVGNALNWFVICPGYMSLKTPLIRLIILPAFWIIGNAIGVLLRRSFTRSVEPADFFILCCFAGGYVFVTELQIRFNWIHLF